MMKIKMKEVIMTRELLKYIVLFLCEYTTGLSNEQSVIDIQIILWKSH